MDGYGSVSIFVSRLIDSAMSNVNVKFSEVELVGWDLVFVNFKISLFCYYCAPDITLDNFKYSLDSCASVIVN